jgi:hypothetical protein
VELFLDAVGDSFVLRAAAAGQEYGEYGEYGSKSDFCDAKIGWRPALEKNIKH